MQLQIMLFFQRIKTPLLEKCAEVASMFGELLIPLIILMLLVWCISRKKAFALATSLLSALLVCQIVKPIVRSPRPFQAYPDLIEGNRLSTATGYSFPSGHSTTSGSMYSSLAIIAWRKIVTVFCIILIIAVPISRLILGVHWPIDVTVGTILGIASGCILTPLMLRLYDNRHGFLIFSFIYGIAATAVSVVLAVLLSTTGIDKVAFNDLMSNAAVAGGAMLGFYFERKAVCSSPEEGSTGKKILRFAIGIATTIAVALIIRIIPAPEAFTSFMTFFMAGIWCTFIYPLIAVKTKLMESEA